MLVPFLKGLWTVLGILSSIVGLVCYALSSSFKQLFGEWKFYKFLLYIMTSLIICGIVVSAKKIQVSTSFWLKAHVAFFALLLTSLYSFFYDKAVKGKPDAFSIVSYAAFALMSLCCSRKFELGFEVGFFYFVLGCLLVQVMKIRLIFVFLAAVFSFCLIIVRSYSDSEDHSGATRSGENLESIRIDLANEVERSQPLSSIGAFPGENTSGHEENVEAKPTEQDNVSSQIQSNPQFPPLRRRHREVQHKSEPIPQRPFTVLSDPLSWQIRHREVQPKKEPISQGHDNVASKVQSDPSSSQKRQGALQPKKENVASKVQSDPSSSQKRHGALQPKKENVAPTVQSDPQSSHKRHQAVQRKKEPISQGQDNVASKVQSDPQSSQKRHGAVQPRKESISQGQDNVASKVQSDPSSSQKRQRVVQRKKENVASKVQSDPPSSEKRHRALQPKKENVASTVQSNPQSSQKRHRAVQPKKENVASNVQSDPPSSEKRHGAVQPKKENVASKVQSDSSSSQKRHGAVQPKKEPISQR